MADIRLGNKVEVIKAPREALHLQGKQGVVTHKERGWYSVKIGDSFTDFRSGDIKVVGSA